MTQLRRMLPSSNALFVFEAAARCGSFTRAAAELNVTQPAVSRMLGRLETHLGVRLFDRSAAGIVLTEDGRSLYRRIAEGFRGIEAAIREIEAKRTGTETVTLSLSTAFTTHWLMPRINRLQKEFPSVDLRFQLIAGPLHGPVDDVDLGMRFVDGGDAGHETSLVMREIMLPICSPAYRERQKATGDGNTIINLAGADPAWPDGFEDLRDDRAGPRSTLSFSDYAIVVQAALLGQGIALGWVTVSSHWLGTGALVPAAGSLMRTGRLCQLVHSRARPMRTAVAEIRDWIIAQTRSDIGVLDGLYPELGVGAAAF
jgi:DNA-binding transcriptional LysR family regulator